LNIDSLADALSSIRPRACDAVDSTASFLSGLKIKLDARTSRSLRFAIDQAAKIFVVSDARVSHHWRKFPIEGEQHRLQNGGLPTPVQATDQDDRSVSRDGRQVERLLSFEWANMMKG